MTIAPPSSALVTEFCGGSSNAVTMDVAMMIGVGLVKDSDAVFFQYLGDDQKPRALTIPTSGKPVYKFQNVRVVGIDIAEDIGEFKSTKLNLYLESSAGNVVLVTSGLTTLWSQAVMCALMGLYNSYDLNTAFTLSSWKGTSKMRPCFASVKIGDAKVSDQMLYDQLRDLRADRAQDKIIATMRDSVEILRHALGVTEAEVIVDEVAGEPAAALPEDIDF